MLGHNYTWKMAFILNVESLKSISEKEEKGFLFSFHSYLGMNRFDLSSGWARR